MSVDELIDLLDPAPERRDEAERILRMLTARHLYDAVSKVSNPPTARAVSRRAHAVAKLAEQLAGEVGALGGDLFSLWQAAELGKLYGPDLRGGVERLRAMAGEAARIAEAAAGLPAAPGRRRVVWARHVAVMNLESLFRRFHRSRFPPEHVRWKATRNHFLHAGLAAVGLDCERRTLEQHLRKLTEDAAAVPTGPVT